MTEDKMVEWHHRLNGQEFEQAPGDGEGQGSLTGYSPWGRRESDMTQQLIGNDSTKTLFVSLGHERPQNVLRRFSEGPQNVLRTHVEHIMFVYFSLPWVEDILMHVRNFPRNSLDNRFLNAVNEEYLPFPIPHYCLY